MLPRAVATALLLLMPTLALANCPDGKFPIKLFYINGILVENQTAAAKSAAALENKLRAKARNLPLLEGVPADCIEVVALYNQSHALEDDLKETGILLDEQQLIALLRGKLASADTSPEDVLRIKTLIAGLIDETYRHREGLQGFVDDYFQPALDDGNLVVIVGHSEGTLFANAAARKLDNPANVRLVAIATPSSFIEGDGPWTTAFEDDIINGSMGLVEHELPFPDPLPSNSGNTDDKKCHERFVGVPLGDDAPILCHLFDYYIEGVNTGPKIVSDVIRAFADRVPPRRPALVSKSLVVDIDNVDDLVDVVLNGQSVAQVGFGDERSVTLTSALLFGPNRLDVFVYNVERGWTYGIDIVTDGGVEGQRCGAIGVIGCSDDDQERGLVWADSFLVTKPLAPDNRLPTAAFSMSVPGQIARDGGELRVTADAVTGEARVNFTDLSTDPDGDADIVFRRWTTDTGCTPADPPPCVLSEGLMTFTWGFTPGRYTVTLTVKDSAGHIATADGVVDVAPAPPLPTLSSLPNTGAADVVEGSVDGYWTLLSGPTCPLGNCPLYVSVMDGFPFDGHWTKNNSTSKWLEPLSGTTDAHPIGEYTYRLTFEISESALAASPHLVGHWATDDLGVDILVNGMSTGLRTSGSFRFAPFAIPFDAFQVGVNTLDFVVVNQSCAGCELTNPVGLRVEFGPEPSIPREVSGGGPHGGFIYSIALDSADPSVIYAASEAASVFKSTDAGHSWTVLSPQLSGTARSPRIVVDPADPKIIYIATRFAGVFKTIDGGNTWTAGSHGLPPSADTTVLSIDPAHSNILYVGTSMNGVFKSTDGGDNWVAANFGLPAPSSVTAMIVDPINPAIVYIGLNTKGIFKTTSGGDSWVGINLGLDLGLPSSRFITALAIDPLNPDILYAALYTSFPEVDSQVFKTLSGGAGGWTPLSALSRVHDIAIDPSNPNHIYAATDSGVASSTDAGQHWVASGLSNPANDVAINPITTSTLYAASSRGISKSTDAGSTWIPNIDGLTAQNVKLLAVDPTNSDVVYAVTTDGIYRTDDGGHSWTEILSLPSRGVFDGFAIDPQTPTTIYAAGWPKRFFKSLNRGQDWVESVLPEFVGTLLVDPITPTTIYGGGHMVPDGSIGGIGVVLKSVDAGQTWMVHSTKRSFVSAVRMAINPLNPSILYFGSDEHMAKSLDGGITWQPAGFGLVALDQPVTGLAIDPLNPSTIYAGIVTSDAKGNIFRTTDSAQHWAPITTGLPVPVPPISSLTIDPVTPSVIYASIGSPHGQDVFAFDVGSIAGNGVFKTVDGGQHWSSASSGLDFSNVTFVAMSPHSPATVYAGTRGFGVFKSTDGGNTWQPTEGGQVP